MPVAPTRPLLAAEVTAAIDAAIESYAEAAFVFLERLVAADSTVGHEQAALEVLASELHGLGFEIERLPVPESVVELPGAGMPLLPYAGRYDLVGRRRGDPALPSLLLNGHIDVVPADEPGLWTSPPFLPERRDGWLFGRGAGDMKCGFAMGVLALRAVRDVMPDEDLGSISLIAAIEEEYTGNGTLAAATAGVLADAVVLLEPTDLTLLRGGIGVLWLEITVLGRAAHAEASAGGVNALETAISLLPALHAAEDELNLEPDPRIDSARPYRLNIGRLHGGDWASSVPSVARMEIRVGYPMGWTPAQAEAVVQRHLDLAAVADPWLADHPPILRRSGFQAEGYDLPADAPLAVALAAAHRDAHGVDPLSIVMASTTDARIYRNRHDLPAICYGPVTTRIHGIDEAVELASIVAGARTLARFLISWSAADERPWVEPVAKVRKRR